MPILTVAIIPLVLWLFNFQNVVSARDPDVGRNATELIRSRGFDAEEYDVLTPDGYILYMQRVVNPRVEPSYRPRLKPVILFHGFTIDSTEYLSNSPDVRPRQFPPSSTEPDIITEKGENLSHPNSLAYYLSNEGYDVFLTNFRGCRYGRRHIRLLESDPEFWSFSLDEMIKYDAPSSIATVQEVTGKKKMACVAHSMGTTIMFGLLADQPEYADIIEPFVALGPSVYFKHVKVPFVEQFETLALKGLLIKLPIETQSRGQTKPDMCDSLESQKTVCIQFFYDNYGYDADNIDETRIPVTFSNLPSGSSARAALQYFSGYKTDKFSHYNFGPEVNLQIYNQIDPPEYDISKIRSKSIALFVADKDLNADPEDVARIIATLPYKPYVVNVTQYNALWNHIDYVYSRYAGEVVNKRVVEYLNRFNDY